MREARPQRRLAAILAADVVGYSRLMELEEAGTLAMLKARRKNVLEPLVAKYQGRIFKITGDGVLIEFGSAVNAVQCAVELQQGMAAANEGQPEDRRIVLRIGVNLGDVMIEGSDLYGDGVNVAARLEGMAEPGGIWVSEDAHRQVRSKLSVSFDDLGAQTLKNIAEPLRAYRVTDVPAVAVAATQPSSHKTSIAVLPFTNMSGDPSQEYFADGLTEDLITALSRFRHLSVLSRNATFQYKGRAVNIPNIGRQLGARYVLEGSARTSGNRVRISAQLIETEGGAHVWAERFDRELSDIFGVQDEIVAAIAAQLTFGLIDAAVASRGRVPTTSLTAYDQWLRGRAAWRRGAVSETHENWLAAVQSDPNYAAALASLAFLYSEDTWMQMLGMELDELSSLAREYAEKAIAVDDGDAFAQLMIGNAWLNLGELDRAKQHLELAIRLNPHYHSSTIVLGCALAFMGQHQEGLSMIERAFMLEPRLPPGMRAAPFYIHCILGDADSALADLTRIESPFAFLHLWMGACLTHAGRDEEARRQIAEFERKRPPRFDIRGFVNCIQRCIRRDDDRIRFIAGFRKAGLYV
jgi:TolB-like protein